MIALVSEATSVSASARSTACCSRSGVDGTVELDAAQPGHATEALDVLGLPLDCVVEAAHSLREGRAGRGTDGMLRFGVRRSQDGACMGCIGSQVGATVAEGAKEGRLGSRSGARQQRRLLHSRRERE